MSIARRLGTTPVSQVDDLAVVDSALEPIERGASDAGGT
jgi:hypothetical protein